MSAKILCLGDSLTFGYGTKARFCWTRLVAGRTGLTLTNRGLCGDTLAGMLQRLPAGLALKPDACLLIGGTNDLFEGRAPDRSAVAAIISACRDAGVRPLLGTPTPMDWSALAPQWAALVDMQSTPALLEDYVQWLRRYAAQERIPLVDLYAALTAAPELHALYMDGVHMTEAGNVCIADAVTPVLAGLYCEST